MTEEKNLTCINCPMGCFLTVELTDGVITKVSGNTCPRGEQYAKDEVTNPVRTVTSTVQVEGGAYERVSVKTKSPVPKGKIFEVMKEINRAKVKAPVHIGDVIVEDCAGTGVPVVAARMVREI